MMKSLFDNLVKHSQDQYDAKKVSQSLLKIKYSENQNLKEKLKLEIYYSQAKLIVKAVNNFFSLLKNISGEKVIHTKEDIAGECYIVMSKCIENLEPKNLKKFHFYLNTSLNRAMFRLYQKQYQKHFVVLSNNQDTEIIMANNGYDDQFDLTSVDLKDFSVIEIEVIKFKFSGEKLSVFLKQMKFTNIDFQYHLDSVKEKLIDLYKLEGLNI